MDIIRGSNTWAIACPKCYNTVIVLDSAIFSEYFEGNLIECSDCKNKYTLWDAAKNICNSTLVTFGQHYGLLGCHVRHVQITMNPGQFYTLDLTEQIGNGELLYIVYTPSGNGNGPPIMPMEMHSNVPLHHIKNKIIHLAPYDYGGKAQYPTNVEIMFWFAPENITTDLSSMMMLDAFQRYYEKNYRYMIISAQTALEILQNKYLDANLVALNLRKEDVNSFRKDVATFYYQLFVLMPLLSSKEGFPLPNEQIIAGCRRLVKSRNHIVHQGECSSQWTEADYMEMLLSAYFLFKYYKVVHLV